MSQKRQQGSACRPSRILSSALSRPLASARVMALGLALLLGHPWPSGATHASPGPEQPSASHAVLVSAVFPDGYAPGDADEAVQLWNTGGAEAKLGGWTIDDGEGTAGFPPGVTLSPGARIWLTRDGAAFARSFGHAPDWVWSTGESHEGRLTTTGGGPTLANGGDDLALRSEVGAVVDLVVYGSGTPGPGWVGATLHPYGTRSIRSSHQILFRKLDPTTAAPVPDTNAAADWACDPLDGILGRRARFPGWDLEGRLTPLQVTERGLVEVALAPDALHGFVRRHLMSASASVDVMLYTFKNPDLAETLAAKARQGVRVRILVDGAPVGGIDMAERWCLAHVSEAGGNVYWLDDGGDVRARYRSAHAKAIVIDDRVVLVGSENLNLASTPYDDRSDGTAGRRGAYIATDAPSVVAWASGLVDLDLDTAHHVDVRPFQPRDPKRGAPAPDFEPPRIGGGSGYYPVAPLPLTIEGVHRFELISSPENALHGRAALLGLLGKAGAGDEVLVQQLSEPLWWGAGPTEGDVALNPRVAAYLEAARRGSRVRLLLDAYFNDTRHWNSNSATARFLNRRSHDERLDLVARLANPTGHGLHNKMVLVRLRGEKEHWSHVGSLNGSEVANKVNREVALQIESAAIHAYLASVYAWDWATTNTIFLPTAESIARPSVHGCRSAGAPRASRTTMLPRTWCAPSRRR